WDGSSELTLTTGLEWSTYLGGSLGEIVSQAVIESNGTILVGGLTSSFDFPTTTGAYDETYGDPPDPVPGGDVFLTRLDLARTKVLALTSSFAFPTPTGAYAETYGDPPDPFPGGDVFLPRLDLEGTTLLSSTYL